VQGDNKKHKTAHVSSPSSSAAPTKAPINHWQPSVLHQMSCLIKHQTLATEASAKLASDIFRLRDQLQAELRMQAAITASMTTVLAGYHE
jgi:hypothetical protein